MHIQKPALEELNSLLDFVRWGASQFCRAELHFGHGTDNAIDEAVYLILHALRLPAPLPENLWHSRLTRSEKIEVLELFRQRIEDRIPAPYLMKKAWFAQLEFYVDQRVLIPRSPLAELIEKQFTPWVNTPIHQVLDLGTGSGCLAIATAMYLPEVQVDAVDISAEALAVAQQNVDNYQLNQRVQLIESDLLTKLPAKRYDIIISNPPYVDAKSLASLPEEYWHEPRLGLEAGDTGLRYIARILQDSRQFLTENGVLIVEVGASVTALTQAYPDLPFTWLMFERGGEGVFLLNADQLSAYFNS